MGGDDDRIRRAKRGEGDAWRELYRAHAGRLLVWLRAVSSGDAALGPEDVAAESWTTAASRIADFQGTAQEFGGWLFGIARRHAANDRRRAGRRATYGADPADLEAAAAPAMPPTDDVDRIAWVRWLLADLPRREREVVGCIDVIGLDVAATASALGMTATAVRVAHHRGLRRLRALGMLTLAR